MATKYPILPIIFIRGNNYYVYGGKVYSKRNLCIDSETFSHVDYLRLSFKGIKLPVINGNYYSCENPKIRHFFGASGFLDIAQWCLCNRDLTQTLFEKHGFDNMTPTRKAFSSGLGQGLCKDKKWGMLLEDFFKQCKIEKI